MDTIRNWWSRFPAAWRLALIVLVVVGVLALAWLYGTRAWNGLGNWLYHHSTTDAHREIDRLKQEAAQQKQIAEQAAGALAAEKLLTAQEKKKHEIAEAILADKTKNTGQKLAVFDKIINAPPTHSGPESVDELCARARALKVRCE